MCQQCHAGVTAAAHVHGPAATDCTSCHKAHTATHKGLLMLESRALCISCHQELGERIAGARHPHDPATGDCLQCHSPHASDHPGVLKAAPKDLCLTCHADVGRSAEGAKHPHSAVTDSRACLNCHAPHDSQHVHLLAAEPVETCLQCHARPIKIEGRTVAAVAELASGTMHRHGPIREGHCSGCHEVHGGAGPQLLTHEYPQGFYQKYSEGSYALCFSCHDKSLVSAEKTTSATNFRDGDRNLHHVHVTKGQGRSCRSCHAVHASASEELIADTVAFGQWKLPINFKSTPEGGSCAPGCHKVEDYDRTATAAPRLSAPKPAAPGGRGPAPAGPASKPLPPPR
jgi:predicted CXXCH cytochrome family protein